MHNTQDTVESIITCFNLYEKKMYYIAYSILNDSYLSEDAVMYAFEKLLKRNKPITDPEGDEAKRLIILVTRSVSIDLYRKNIRTSKHECSSADLNEISAKENADIDGSKTSRPFRDSGIPAEVDSEITILDDIPDIYRSVLFELYYNNRSVSETARKLGISESAVRKRKERGLTLLRERRTEYAKT